MPKVAVRGDLDAVAKGAVVLDSSGEVVGVVDGVVVDPETGRTDGVTIRVGGMLRTFFGGGECVRVSAGEITESDEQTVRLNSTKAAFDYLTP